MTAASALRRAEQDSESLLDEFTSSIMESPDIHFRSKDVAADTVARLWHYLDRTPGEQLPCAAFGEMLGVNGPAAYSRLGALEKLGIITKTASRKGAGGGIGFVCAWLEARRGRAPETARPRTKAQPAPMSDPEGMLDGLERIDAAADRAVEAARRLGASDSTLTITQALREIQALVAAERKKRLRGTA